MSRPVASPGGGRRRAGLSRVSLLHPPLRDTESPSVDYVHQGMSRPVASPGGGRRRAGLSPRPARDRRSGGGAQVGAPLQFMDGLEDLVGVASVLSAVARARCPRGPRPGITSFLRAPPGATWGITAARDGFLVAPVAFSPCRRWGTPRASPHLGLAPGGAITVMPGRGPRSHRARATAHSTSRPRDLARPTVSPRRFDNFPPPATVATGRPQARA